MVILANMANLREAIKRSIRNILVIPLLVSVGLSFGPARAAPAQPPAPVFENAPHAALPRLAQKDIPLTDSGFDGETQTTDKLNGLGDDAWVCTFTASKKIEIEVRDEFLVGDYYTIYMDGKQIGSTLVVSFGGPMNSTGKATAVIAPGPHRITITDPGGVMNNIIPAGYHVKINVSPIALHRPVIYAHGINEDATTVGTPDGFQGLIEQLKATLGEDSLTLFKYLDDQALRVNGVCPKEVVPPCLSQGAISLNGPSLANLIRDQYKAMRHKVALIGYSMGGAIIRNVLAGCPKLADPATRMSDAAIRQALQPANLQCADVASMIDNVFFIEAVHQGSWLLSLRDSLQNGNFAERAINGAATVFFNKVWHLELDQPAERELQPGSNEMRAVSLAPLPAGIHYFNVYGDIHFDEITPLPGLVTDNGDPVALLQETLYGDFAILPGSNDPAHPSVDGGARFCPNCQPANGYEYNDAGNGTTFTQWGLTNTFTWNKVLLVPKALDEQTIFDLLSQLSGGIASDETFGATDAIKLLGDILKQPAFHLYIGTKANFPKFQIADVSGKGGNATISVEFTRLLVLNEGVFF